MMRQQLKVSMKKFGRLTVGLFQDVLIIPLNTANQAVSPDRFALARFRKFYGIMKLCAFFQVLIISGSGRLTAALCL